MPLKKYLEYSMGWWINQEKFRERIINRIFLGPLRRENGVKNSVYQILEFENPVIPLANISLFDITPVRTPTGGRLDQRVINLKNYRNHIEIVESKVLDTMTKLGLDTQYLAHRGYIAKPRLKI